LVCFRRKRVHFNFDERGKNLEKVGEGLIAANATVVAVASAPIEFIFPWQNVGGKPVLRIAVPTDKQYLTFASEAFQPIIETLPGANNSLSITLVAIVAQAQPISTQQARAVTVAAAAAYHEFRRCELPIL